ncbi:MAG TPA: AAA family ATPase [Chitinophagaceae bacterium]|jgi:hypothetical protein|nr:AAA family ATPase [Chitinophagaceae bacterium]
MSQSEISSPFKFLDPYNRQDKDIFFGRKDEVERLYQHVNKNRIVLIYGTSGSGKTSLVQCGLANRLEVTDWVPFFIRRGQDINRSLLENLLAAKALAGVELKGSMAERLVLALDKIGSFYLRPVYLIFDQFEELLILGEQEEKDAFIGNLQSILLGEETKSCNLLFIMREEYFAALDIFEQKIPGFSDRRLRVETMRPKKVKEVILRSCEKFNIKLEAPEENAQQIIDILKGKTGISLPYLQVYLDQLWKHDFGKTYPEGSTEAHPELEFTTEEIRTFGVIKDVLDRFLGQRKQALQRELEEAFDPVPDDFITSVLDSFVTDEGTKLPIIYERKNGEILLKNAPEYLKRLPAPPLAFALNQLEASRILRTDGDSIELAHDILAALIDQQRSDEQRRLNEIRRSIRNGYHNYKQLQEYLTGKQIAKYEDVINKLGLEEEYIQFFEESRIFRKEEENRKLAEAEQRTEEERMLRLEADTARETAQEKAVAAREAEGKAKTNALRAKVISAFAFFLAIICFLLFRDSAIRKNEIQKSRDALQVQKNRSVEQAEMLAQEISRRNKVEFEKLQTDVEVLKKAGEVELASRLINEKRELFADRGLLGFDSLENSLKINK